MRDRFRLIRVKKYDKDEKKLITSALFSEWNNSHNSANFMVH